MTSIQSIAAHRVAKSIKFRVQNLVRKGDIFLFENDVHNVFGFYKDGQMLWLNNTGGGMSLDKAHSHADAAYITGQGEVFHITMSYQDFESLRMLASIAQEDGEATRVINELVSDLEDATGCTGLTEVSIAMMSDYKQYVEVNIVGEMCMVKDVNPSPAENEVYCGYNGNILLERNDNGKLILSVTYHEDEFRNILIDYDDIEVASVDGLVEKVMRNAAESLHTGEGDVMGFLDGVHTTILENTLGL